MDTPAFALQLFRMIEQGDYSGVHSSFTEWLETGGIQNFRERISKRYGSAKAEDLLQQTLCKALEGLLAQAGRSEHCSRLPFRPTEATHTVGGWLILLCEYIEKDQQRGAKKRREAMDKYHATILKQRRVVGQGVESRSLALDVNRRVGSPSSYCHGNPRVESRRRAILKMLLQNYTPSEIADELSQKFQVDRQTVKTDLKALYAYLRERLEPWNPLVHVRDKLIELQQNGMGYRDLASWLRREQCLKVRPATLQGYLEAVSTNGLTRTP